MDKIILLKLNALLLVAVLGVLVYAFFVRPQPTRLETGRFTHVKGYVLLDTATGRMWKHAQGLTENQGLASPFARS